jgi:hypothetical protein
MIERGELAVVNIAAHSDASEVWYGRNAALDVGLQGANFPAK